MNNRKCPSCLLVNFALDETCRRCGAALAGETTPNPYDDTHGSTYGDAHDGAAFADDRAAPANDRAMEAPRRGWLRRRGLVVLGVALCVIFALHVSLILTSAPVTAEQRRTVMRAVRVLEERGFATDARLLRHVASFRTNDNWWNATVGHADAYAATNFPFGIVTLYPQFFDLPVDDTERAAILLHEAQHMRGANEAVAFTEVWRRRAKLGWTEDVYGATRVWRGTAQLTREHAPQAFADPAIPTHGD